MIPIKLKAKGFLTFKNEIEINFEDVYGEGIFLISGPTGSGKTSIFDAITYALYDKVSSKERNETKKIKSDFLQETDEMFVELEFRANDKNYKITRIRKGKTTEKDILENLTDSEENSLTKKRDIEQKIKDIIGLEYDQFTKIIMLPQGEFRNFLVAPQQEKTKILTTIFGTDKYSEVIKKLREEAALKENEIKQQKESIKKEFSKYDFLMDLANADEQYEKLQDRTQLLIEEIKRTKETIAKLDLEIKIKDDEIKSVEKNNQEIQKVKKLEEQLDSLESRKDEFEKLRKEIELLQEVSNNEILFDNYNQAKEGLNKTTEDKVVTEERLLDSNEKFEEYKSRKLLLPELEVKRENLNSQNNKLNEEIENIKTSDLLKKNLETLFKQRELIQEKEKELDRLRVEKEEKGEVSRSIQKELNNLMSKSSYLIEQRSNLKNELEKLESTIKLKKDLDDENSKLNQISSLLVEGETQLIKQREVFTKLEQEYQKQGLALYIDSVREGEPCPLCGSIHHPDVFKQERVISESEFTKAKQELEKLNTEVLRLTERKNNVSENKEKLEKQLSQNIEQSNLELSNIENIFKEKESELQRVKAEEELIKERKIRYEKEDKSNTDRLNEIKTNIESIKTTLDDKDLVNKEITEKETQINLISSKLTGNSEEAIKEMLLKNQAEISRIQLETKETNEGYDKYLESKTTLTQKLENLKEHEKKYTDTEAVLREKLDKILVSLGLDENGFKGKIKEIIKKDEYINQVKKYESDLKNVEIELKVKKDQLETTEIQDLTDYISNFNKLNEEKKLIEKQAEEYKKSETLYSESLRTIEKENESIASKKGPYEVLKNLSDAADKGVDFNTYVLTYFLDGVLENANNKLKSMTNGRYQLVRKEEKKGNNKNFGLELLIYDSFTDKSREVASLSGGESFKASLALALGLSEYIQERKGIRNLETIFIDEGFGTLDPESLDQALEILLELKSNGRKVGIISHVEELKTRIPSKILLSNQGMEGSSIKVVHD